MADEDDFTEVIAAAESEDVDATVGDTRRVSGWGRIFRGNKALWITAAVAVVCLVAGLLVGRFVIAPASEAEAPTPGLVTVPVTLGELSNDVIIRADFGYADATELKLDGSAGGGTPVITGSVPEAGDTLSAKSVILEIAGRPVIALPGELPAYRSLGMGSSGPDVIQLKQALKSLGFNPGDVESNVFDQSTADAIAALYKDIGYPPPPAPEGAEEALRGAEAGLRDAREGLAAAKRQLEQARGGPDAVAVKNADNAIAAAQDALDLAKLGEPKGEDATPEAIKIWQNSVREAQRLLDTAKLERQQLFASNDVSAERQAVTAAEQHVTAAQEAVAAARRDTQAYMPDGEIVYLQDLPRRIDSVNVRRGDIISGEAVMTVSSATLRVSGTAAEADARYIKVGDEGYFELPDGGEHRAVISDLVKPQDGDRWQVMLEPDELTNEQIEMLQGSNIRLRIAVGATEGAVLQVPLAALSAGPGGVSRVEVALGDPRDPNTQTRIVDVETGLASQGLVEVRALNGDLSEGDLVVVGR